jgi:hypothetical protein
MKRVWSITLLLMALSACSEFQTYGSGGYAPVVTRGVGTEYWLKELHDTRWDTSGESRQRVLRWEQELLQDPNDGTRVKLALLLIAGNEDVRDPERARELLDGLTDTLEDASDREFLTLIGQILDQQEQASEEIGKLNRQLGKQNRRIRELEKQQRALTDIEQNIQQRTVQPETEDEGQ